MTREERDATISVMWCASFASAVTMRICDPMLPQLQAAFAASTGQVALTVSAFAVAYGVMQFVWGPLGDRFGKLHVISWTALASTFACIGAALSPSLEWLIASRIGMGMTSAAIVPLGLAWIGDVVPYTERQSVLARFISGSVVGLLVGQVIGGIFADLIGWRLGFVLLSLFYAVAGVLLVRPARIAHGPLAWRGMPRTTPAAPYFTTMVGILRQRWAQTLIVAGFLEGAFAFGALAFMPTHLHFAHGLSLSAAGAVLAVYGIGGLAYTRMALRLVRRLGEPGLAAGGGTLMGLSYLAVAYAPHWPWSIAAMFLAGLGFYMMHGTMQVNATQMAPRARGTGTTLFVSILFLGQSAGVSAAAMLADHVGIRFVLLISAVALPLIGLGFAAQLRRRAETPH